MESRNVWQQFLGGNIWGANSMKLFLRGGGKMGNNFFLKQIFLGGNFREQVLKKRSL